MGINNYPFILNIFPCFCFVFFGYANQLIFIQGELAFSTGTGGLCFLIPRVVLVRMNAPLVRASQSRLGQLKIKDGPFLILIIVGGLCTKRLMLGLTTGFLGPLKLLLLCQ